MGLKGRPDHPDVQAAIAKLESAIRDSDVVLGGAALNPDQANAMTERGYCALMIGFDWLFLQRGAASAMDGVGR
jgi:4-hydroxy-2-oxoheptanedioate aldolase